jgi:chemotaxis protein CheD
MDLGEFRSLHVIGGQCVISDDPKRLLRTVLGSCVSACLYDPVKGIGGMNHFILHDGGINEPLERQHRYGDTAMRSLVDRLCKRGAKPAQLRAKLYGGRLKRGPGIDPGALNASFAVSFLHHEGIPIVDASLGDHFARWVTFHPVSGEVMLREAPDLPLQAPPPAPVGRHVPH